MDLVKLPDVADLSSCWNWIHFVEPAVVPIFLVSQSFHKLVTELILEEGTGWANCTPTTMSWSGFSPSIGGQRFPSFTSPGSMLTIQYSVLGAPCNVSGQNVVFPSLI